MPLGGGFIGGAIIHIKAWAARSGSSEPMCATCLRPPPPTRSMRQQTSPRSHALAIAPPEHGTRAPFDSQSFLGHFGRKQRTRTEYPTARARCKRVRGAAPSQPTGASGHRRTAPHCGAAAADPTPRASERVFVARPRAFGRETRRVASHRVACECVRVCACGRLAARNAGMIGRVRVRACGRGSHAKKRGAPRGSTAPQCDTIQHPARHGTPTPTGHSAVRAAVRSLTTGPAQPLSARNRSCRIDPNGIGAPT